MAAYVSLGTMGPLSGAHVRARVVLEKPARVQARKQAEWKTCVAVGVVGPRSQRRHQPLRVVGSKVRRLTKSGAVNIVAIA